jgi:hypothetical protein
VIRDRPKTSEYVFATSGTKHFQTFAKHKRSLDDLSGVNGWRLHDLRRTIVSGMARLGIPPHIADKILNHQSGTISGVAAVYQRHEFLVERKDALDRWGTHVDQVVQTYMNRGASDPANDCFAGVRSTGQCNTACSLLAGVSKPKVFRGR